MNLNADVLDKRLAELNFSEDYINSYKCDSLSNLYTFSTEEELIKLVDKLDKNRMKNIVAQFAKDCQTSHNALLNDTTFDYIAKKVDVKFVSEIWDIFWASKCNEVINEKLYNSLSAAECAVRYVVNDSGIDKAIDAARKSAKYLGIHHNELIRRYITQELLFELLNPTA